MRSRFEGAGEGFFLGGGDKILKEISYEFPLQMRSMKMKDNGFLRMNINEG